MKFTKMNGLGNDFIIVYGESALPADAAALAEKLCNRYFGIGADGLVYILPSAKADFMMRIMNSDGSEAEQCGNAIRCVAKYVYDHKFIDRTDITIETIGAGVQPLQLDVKDGIVTAVRVDMGEPILEGTKVPTTIDQNQIVRHPIEVEGREFEFTAVSMGNPHCVIFCDSIDDELVTGIGAKIERHPLFPRRTNVEFVTPLPDGSLRMRVYERGSGETMACGTGACAVGVAARLNGMIGDEVLVHLLGGDLEISWSGSGSVFMRGPAVEVFSGELSDAWLTDEAPSPATR